MIQTTRTPTVVACIVLLLLASCSSSPEAGGVRLAPISMLPDEIRVAAQSVRTAYQFALAEPEALRNVPCYCGCGDMGHTSNLSCFVRDDSDPSNPIFDTHALGCSICVDIAQDVMRMTADGREPAAIRAEIVATYSRFGPPNQ